MSAGREAEFSAKIQFQGDRPRVSRRKAGDLGQAFGQIVIRQEVLGSLG